MNQGPLVGSTVFHGTLVAVVVCACPGVSSAECLPTLSNRCLIINASDIIIAQPVDPEPFRGKSRHAFAIQVRNGTRVDQGERFRVVGVLRGSAAKRGEVVRVTGIYFYHLRNAWSVSEAERENEGDAVKQVILFLRQARNPDPKNKAFELSLSGIRCLTEDGEVLYPVQFINPGDYYLVALDGPDWDELIANVKAEIPKVAQALALKEIADPAARNRAVFSWIERHYREFKGYSHWKPGDRAGWGRLESEPFQWILDSCRPQDGWRALKLFRRIHVNSPYGLTHRTLAFASVEGRRLLLDIATDPHTSQGDRRMALYFLPGAFWSGRPRVGIPGLSVVTPEEQGEIIEKLVPLLRSDDGKTRKLVACALRRASIPTDALLWGQWTEAALPALIEAYQDQPPGEARNELARSVWDLAGQEHWKEISGNPAGILVVVVDYFSTNRNYGWEKICFRIKMATKNRTSPPQICQQPTLILERLAENGKVLQRKTMPIPLDYPKEIDWSQGWPDTSSGIALALPSGDLAEGTWQFVVEGVAGKQGEYKWRSEPALFKLRRGGLPAPARN